MIIKKIAKVVSQDIRDYYKNKYGFDDVDFLLPDDTNNLKLNGKIILTKEGHTIELDVPELYNMGFDGIDDVMEWHRDSWSDVING